MDEGDAELSAVNSIIATRQRRSNAGNRLKTLLQMQEPLEDEEQIFVEVEDDREFDIDAVDEENEPNGEQAQDNDNDSSGDEDQNEGDDENFSDSSDSEIEKDEEPEDAGEQALLKQQKEQKKEKRRAEKRKMFEIKVRDTAPRPAKARKFVAKAESLLDSDRRVSKRTLAIQNKERVIERLRENERRKAEYVSPVIKKAPKMTQEQRLEEAKITELKNTASLHHFVEIEEYRKQQQRLMWANRRPKLSNFIRYSSRSMLEYPGIIVDITEDVKEEQGPPTPQSREGSSALKEEEQADSEHRADSELLAESERQDTSEYTEPQDASEAPSESREVSQPPESEVSQTEEVDDMITEETALEATETNPIESVDIKEEELPDDAELMAQHAKKEEEKLAQQEEEEVQEEIIREVEGPPAISTFNSITMHDFPDSAYNKHTVKGVYFGKQVLRSSSVPAKRICPITGNIARYLDPKTGIAYYSLKTYEILNMIRNHEVAWSNELGGVYLGLRGGQRHASGVPEGFD